MFRPFFIRNLTCLVLTTVFWAPPLPLLADEPPPMGKNVAAATDLDDARAVEDNPVAKKLALAFENILSMGNKPGATTHEQLRIKALFYNKFDEWFLLHRPVLPVYYKPEATDEGRDSAGLGDLNYRLYLSQGKGGKVHWGIGPALVLPTATDSQLGAGKWSLGPAIGFVSVHGKTTFGLAAFNIWSVAGESGRPSVKLMQVVPIFNHVLGNNWYIGSSPEIYANWNLDKKNRWLIPLGAGMGKAFRVGNQAVAFRLASYYNIERPEGASKWDVRLYFNFLFSMAK